MKRNFLLLSFLAFSPLYAFGDFVPGRVRESADANLTRQAGDGRYLAVQGALTEQLKTDGHGITGFRLTFQERSAPALFVVTKQEPNRCGRSYIAQLSGSPATALRIDEITPEACRQEGAASWRATLQTNEADGTTSHLVLHGIPRFYLLTE